MSKKITEVNFRKAFIKQQGFLSLLLSPERKNKRIYKYIKSFLTQAGPVQSNGSNLNQELTNQRRDHQITFW